VAGAGDTAGNASRHATIWSQQGKADLGTLGGASSDANDINDINDINDSGWVEGRSSLGNGISHAFLWNGSAMTDLNSLLDADVRAAGWVITEAYGINDAGAIVGTAFNHTLNQPHDFVLSTSPVPEPVGAALWLAALARRRASGAAR